ncbi:MAG: hypothetical protein FWF96_03315 [Kiritimatiellaeota bacterium]|nr:hypothetical protein [Kiritimatiellota bacterium]
MLYWLGVLLDANKIFGPFRLLTSHLVLMAAGTLGAGFMVWFFLPRWKGTLPRDRGKALVKDGHQSAGKPTGAGFWLTMILLPIMFLCVPLSEAWDAGIYICIFLAMITGYFDDKSARPWGEWRKGLCDLGIAFFTALFLCKIQNTNYECCVMGEPCLNLRHDFAFLHKYRLEDVTIWLPFMKESFKVSWQLYLPMATVLLWFTVNATNCSDGVDGLAGSLTLIALASLAALLYGIIGYKPVADYLLIPHSPDGARWAILLFTTAGGLAGYLW